jgi:hypothetical protein
MTIHYVREGAEVYGARIGILHLPCRIPFVRGGVGHAATFDYPVVYRSIEGCDAGLDGAGVLAAAGWLERQGVTAITADCGALIRCQREVADAVKVPVMLSPLLQVPMLLASIAPSRRIGIVAAVADNVDDAVLAMAGVDEPGRVVVAGMQDQPAFRSAIVEESGVLDTRAVERETVGVARALVEADIAALVFDCADLPPSSRAVRTEVGRPVFDFVTMIDLLERATADTTVTTAVPAATLANV